MPRRGIFVTVFAAVTLAGALTWRTGEAAREPVLEPGVWTGDITVGGGSIGVRFAVGGRGAGTRVRMLSLASNGVGSVELSALSAVGDGLHFELRGRTRRSCSLQPDTTTGGYAGACRGWSGQPWRIRMLPPGAAEAPTGRAAVLLAGDAHWETFDAGSVRLHLPRGALGEVAARRVLASAVEAVRDGQALLEQGRYDRRLRVFGVADRTAMQRFGGRPAGGIADPLAATVLITGYGAPTRALRHEIMHVLSVDAWGPPAPPEEWLLEGLATFAMGDCRGHDFDTLARRLLDERRIVPFDTLRAEFFRLDDRVSYLQSASLIGWVHRRQGAAGVHALWRDGAGPDAPALEAAWLAHLETVPAAATAADWATIAAEGCDGG